MRVIVCTNHRMGDAPSCGNRGSRELLDSLRALGLEAEEGPCLGRCAEGPNAKVLPSGAVVCGASAERVAAHLSGLDAVV